MFLLLLDVILNIEQMCYLIDKLCFLLEDAVVLPIVSKLDPLFLCFGCTVLFYFMR